MLCTLSRWMISRTEDAGKKLPRIAERHVRSCPACGEYARACASLTSRLRAERSAWLAEAPDFSPLAGFDAESSPAAPIPHRPRLALRPLPVAAAALAVIAVALILSQVVFKASAPSEAARREAADAIRSLSAAPQDLSGIIEEAESPLVRERRILERSVASAVEYLQARLNIKIERREPPAKSGRV
jgi:hypothetical protein